MSLIKIRAALETALANMPGIIPAATIASSSKAGIFTTVQDHNLSSGLQVTVSGHSTVNGTYEVDVTGAKTFELIDNALQSVVSGGSVGTGGTVKAELFAWENFPFSIKAPRVPYQKVHLLPGRPENFTLGDSHVREVGILQVTLMFPAQLGSGDAVARAELIRTTFPRGATFENGGIVVQIERTPEIMPAYVNDENYMLPVRIYYYADIFN